MTLLRRFLHIVAWMGTVLVVLLALTFIASQTPWFRDWIRRAIVREARQYVNGELTIGQLSGNLFFGVNLSDVAVDISGERIIAIKTLAVDYDIRQLISRGIVVNRIALTAPAVHLARTAGGWNIGRIVKAQRREANREGPGRSLSLPSISIVDATVTIDDKVGSTSYHLPHRIDDLDVQARFEYEPVHFTIELGQLSFRAADPELALQQLTGGIAVRDDNLYLERMVLKTGESALQFRGVVEQYLGTPIVKI